MTKADFMARTIESHMLHSLELVDVMYFVPSGGASLREAYYYAQNTSYFERKGILITDSASDENLTLENSFAKWLAIQKHDIEAVNSLHEWRKTVADARWDILADIGELEVLITNPAVKDYIEPILERKEAEYKELSQLRHDLGNAIDKVRATEYTARATA